MIKISMWWSILRKAKMIFPHRWVRSIPFPSQTTPPPMANGSAIIIIMRNCNNQTGPPNQTWNTGFPWIKTIFIPNQKFPASLKHLLANPLTSHTFPYHSFSSLIGLTRQQFIRRPAQHPWKNTSSPWKPSFFSLTSPYFVLAGHCFRISNNVSH